MVYSTRRFVVCLTTCHFVLLFFSPFSIAITSLGEERANLSAFRTFVRFVLVWICQFPLPLGVWEGLRFVIVALPGLFSYFFLETVGQYQDTYGSLLVPIVLEKLRGEIRKNLAREHGDSNWKLDSRRAINREINIIEAGVPRNQPDIEAYGSTASFFAGAKSKPRQTNRSDSGIQCPA